VGPPQTDRGIESRDEFLCVSKDLLGGLLLDGVYLLPVVTVSYRQRLDTQQVGLEVGLDVYLVVWRLRISVLDCFQFNVVLQAGLRIFEEWR